MTKFASDETAFRGGKIARWDRLYSAPVPNRPDILKICFLWADPKFPADIVFIQRKRVIRPTEFLRVQPEIWQPALDEVDYQKIGRQILLGRENQ